jgi:hypothetical protein
MNPWPGPVLILHDKYPDLKNGRGIFMPFKITRVNVKKLGYIAAERAAAAPDLSQRGSAN